MAKLYDVKYVVAHEDGGVTVGGHRGRWDIHNHLSIAPGSAYGVCHTNAIFHAPIWIGGLVDGELRFAGTD